MYPLMISLLLVLKKSVLALVKLLGKTNKNNALESTKLSKNELDSLYGLSNHLQKDIGLPPYTRR